MRSTTWAGLAATLLLAACGTQPVNLAPALQSRLEGVQPVVLVTQTNLDVDVNPGNPGSTGLLGALIVQAMDEARRKKAQETSGAFVDALADFGFRERMPQQLDAEFARLKSPRFAGPSQLETTDSESHRRIVLDTSRANAVLFVKATYKLVESKLVLILEAVMYPKAKALMAFRDKANESNPLDPGNAIYRKAFVFRSETIARERIQTTLAEGMSNVAWQLAADLGHVAGTQDAVRTQPLPPVAGGRPARATVTAAAAPSQAATVAASTAPSVPVAVPAAVDTRVSRWAGTLTCGPFLGAGTVSNMTGFNTPAHMTMQGSHATMTRSAASYRETVEGDVAIDGTLVLRGRGAATATPDQWWSSEVSGRFESVTRFRGTGKILNQAGRATRECVLELAPA